MDKTERIKRLKELLNLTKMTHRNQIMNEPTLKSAHVYCVVNRVSAQQYGPLLEYYIRKKYDYSKTKKDDCQGDCSKNGQPKNSILFKLDHHMIVIYIFSQRIICHKNM